ncbi:MAG: hypothetical protein COA79_25775 [Planctomycetota bacterium]|nr:MAG: hypothetical protein COA79_25775 [Planctomycetota bacterium]
MSIWPTIPAKSMIRFKLILNGKTIEKATVFPFFDGNGVTQRVLVIRPDSILMTWFEWSSKSCMVPYWEEEGKVTGVACHTLTPRDLELFGTLWHYDPCWILKEARFAGHWAPGVLKATNCVDKFRFKHVRAARIHRELGQMHGAWVQNKWGLNYYYGWKRLGLAMAPDQPERMKKIKWDVPGDWKLSPIWER